MTPAVSAGDHVMMEGLTFLARSPRRGDVVAFKTDGIGSLPPAQFFVMRLAGEPGEELSISDGKLYVNGHHVALSNKVGEISYQPPITPSNRAIQTKITVPDGSYFLLGDNSTNSYDSRFWGCVPRQNIAGRMSFSFWPRGRIGHVK